MQTGPENSIVVKDKKSSTVLRSSPTEGSAPSRYGFSGLASHFAAGLPRVWAGTVKIFLKPRLFATFLIALAALVPFSASADVHLAEPNTAALTNGLVAYWPLNGNTTNWTTDTTADISGNGNTGALSGMSTTSSPTTGKIGGGLKFNGTNSYVATGYTVPAQNSSTSFTWSTWAYLNTTSHGNLVIIGNRGGGGATWIKLTPTAFEYSGGIISYSPPTGKWLLLTVVKNGSNFTYYQNGVVVGSGSSAASTASYTFYMGEDPGYAPDGDLTGTLDDVRVYNRALSAQEISLLYALGTIHAGNTPAVSSSFSIAQGGLNSGLIGYWPLDGNTTNWTGGTTADISGNGNAGTLTSMSAATSPVPGKIGGALKFNGTTSQFVEASGQVSLGTVNQPYTIVTWVMPASASESGDIFHLSSASNGSSWCIPPLTMALGKPEAVSWNSGQVLLSGPNSLNPNQWYQLVTTWNSTSGLSLYVNGVLQANTAQSTYSASGVSDYITLGSSNTTRQRVFRHAGIICRSHRRRPRLQSRAFCAGDCGSLLSGRREHRSLEYDFEHRN